MMRKGVSLLTVLSLLLAGCSLPGLRFSGPNAQATYAQRQQSRYVIHRITPALLLTLHRAANKTDTPQANPALQQALQDYRYRVGPQDVLNIIVWNHPELTLSQAQISALSNLTGGLMVSAPASQGSGFVVSAKGTIFFPYAGTVKVAGETVNQIRARLSQALATYIKDPQIDVQVVGFHSQTYQLAGAVMKPGLYPLTNVPLTVSEAIASAGGVVNSLPSSGGSSLSDLMSLPLADLAHVILIHDDTRAVLDLRDFYLYGDQTQDHLIRAGDIIQVPNNSFDQVHLIGEVMKQGNYPMSNGSLNLAQALGEAGGINLISANPTRIFVFRGAYAKPQVFWLNARSPEAMLLATQFELQPQDVVYVASTGLADWNRVINQILPTVQTLYETKVLGNL
ncbi:MAG: polysaccharide biosynthesis/export family protein [Gammaproteobacteria bacterium]